MNRLNVKKGDTVVVISGKDKGKQGKVSDKGMSVRFSFLV